MLGELRRRLGITWRLAADAALEFLELVWAGVSGYGEKPRRIFWSGSAVLLVFTLLYRFFGGDQLRNVWKALYFSAVSFVALGYGSWVQEDGLSGAAQALGVIEALIGVFLIATFAASLRRR